MQLKFMNRIYQGRVSKVEIFTHKDDNPWQPLDNWQAVLWQHHMLFQDAVNYYTLALAAMATGVQGDNPQASALRGWVKKVQETWQTASRKSENFAGPQMRLAAILKISNDCTFEQAAARVIQSSHASAERLAAALQQLLAEKGDLNIICGERIAFLCPANPRQTKPPTSKAISSVQVRNRQKEVRKFHQMAEAEAISAARDLRLDFFITQPGTELLEGTAAVKELRQKFSKAAGHCSELKSISVDFEKFLATHENSLKIPSIGRRPSGIYPFAAIFKYYPCAATLQTFRAATKSLADAKDKAAVLDAIADARVDNQPHFDFFTNLAFTSGETDDKRDTRAVWFEFDLAAFVEAIKAPRRYFEDTLKRKANADHFRKQILAMEERGYEGGSDDEEGELLPGFDGDRRIDLIKIIVQDKLKWVAEAEENLEGSGVKEYAIRERTVRGFAEIKRRWQAAAEAGQATEARLLEIMAAEQTEHREDFGSATLYQQLAKPEFHAIWRETGSQPWHAEDPLAAWLKYKNLQSDLADKERAIRFTPAHPEHSPRYFIFPKKSETQPKNTKRFPAKPSLLSRHDPGQLSFTGGIILATGGGFMPTVARIHYSAPRICRDQLRSQGDSDLHEAPWLQPMMAALGLDQTPDHVNFANCRITLQPANQTDIQLTFPVEVNTEKIKAVVVRENVWEKQFNLFPDGEHFYNASLRWPQEKQPNKPSVPWHEKLNSFHCVATDLGQRDAGAFARLLVSCIDEFGKRPSRFVGSTGSKQWRALLERSGMFRLPGEDAPVWRSRTLPSQNRPSPDDRNPHDQNSGFDFREELWGERGRPARDWETDETAALMQKMEMDADDKSFSLLPNNWRARLSFPEQNDKLLIAMRRFQSRIARLHRWCCFLHGNGKQPENAWNEILECQDSRLISTAQNELAKKRDPRLLPQLELQLQNRLELAPRLLVCVANRILPLCGRSWCWEKHPNCTDKIILHHLTQNGPRLESQGKPVWTRGQRGLSLERIEQIEELRKRFQSLNQTQRRTIGGPAPIRRDESVPDPCPDLLDKLDNLKEQRTNQTAHLILAEALGLKLAPPPADKATLRQQRDQHGVYEKIRDKSGHWIGPVDFIIIEDLSRYRASQGRAPRENSRLMKWCHRAIRSKLTQLCEVFGLPVLETPAAYSSRFCSRSGVPGFRAMEIAPGFENDAPWSWIKDKEDDDGKPTAEAGYLQELIQQIADAQKIPTASGKMPAKPRTLFAPLAGGPIFIPIVEAANGVELAPAITQADINAAINLALRAVADPKLWAIHPRLRTQRAGTDKVRQGNKSKATQTASNPESKGRLLAREKRKFGGTEKVLVIQRQSTAKPDETRQPNFFADLAGLDLVASQVANDSPGQFNWLKKEWTSATIEGESGTPRLLHSKSFWGTVKAAQWGRIRAINAARLAAWKSNADNLAM